VKLPLVLPVLMVQSSAHRTTARLQRTATLRRVAEALEEAIGQYSFLGEFGEPVVHVNHIRRFAAELRAAVEAPDG
jgi:hypothetical protein